MMSLRLSDYALIGNSRSAALVGKNGSIDWCCLPEFHSPSIFAAILDRTIGGFFSIAPVEAFSSVQNYLPDTNVAATYFTTSSGEARLLDAFVVMTEEEKTASLFADHEIMRVVEGVTGVVSFRLEYAPTIFYGKYASQLKDRKKLGIHFAWKENIYVLLSTLDPAQMNLSSGDQKVIAEFTVKPGEQIIFSLSYSNQSPAIIPEIKTTGLSRMQLTINYWQNWIARCKYNGLYKEQVKRSALVLKLLTHAPSGAIVAAPTTSLPEELGGERNWDYRYCWLRDASFTVRVLLKLGFEEEAHAYMNWILHATRLTRPEIQVVYSVYGHATLKEKLIDWLEGYHHSRPVRIGNKADKQFQVDVYGEVLDAVYTYSSLIKEFSHDDRQFIIGLGKVICRLWDRPDNGIWEVRSSSVHHTHSKVMAWVGLDRLIKLCSKNNWKEAPLEKFKQTAAQIKNEVERFGYNQEHNTYTREFNGNTVDASLLVLPLVNYCEASSPGMVSTIKMIEVHLCKNNLVYRYRTVDDGLSGGEGAFGICTCWLAEGLARAGRIEKAKEVFETLLQHAGAAGLLSEEIDPETHELLGNYPQSFTHIGLINAAMTINEIYQNRDLVG
jgi:GH15 family glucan-1,4-alpha-glucosidase